MESFNLKEELENQFKKLKKTNKNFALLNGDKKILLSAPHAVEQTRDGKIKFAEPETALIALYLNSFGYPAIIKTTNENDDANHDVDCLYKNNLLQYCKSNNIKFIVDLHQLSPKRDMDFCLGTGDFNNKNLANKSYLLNNITEEISKSQFNYKINYPFAAAGLGTISGYMSNQNFSSIQIEINSNLVSSYCNAKFFDEVCKLIKNIVLSIEKEVELHENIISK